MRSWPASGPSIREQEIYVRGPGPRRRFFRLARRPPGPPDAPDRGSAELGVRLGGEELAAPHGVQATPSDLLSAELDRYGRDPIYEEAVAAAALAGLRPANPDVGEPPVSDTSQTGLRDLSDTKCANFVPIHARPWRLAGRRTHPVSHGVSEANRGAGTYHHINSCGVFGATVFRDDDDRATFLRLLEEELERSKWSCLSYTVLTTHYHVLIKLTEPSLSSGFQRLNGRFARAINSRYGRRGALWQRRFSRRHTSRVSLTCWR